MLGSHTRTNQDGLSRGHRYDRDVHANDGDDVGHPHPSPADRSHTNYSNGEVKDDARRRPKPIPEATHCRVEDATHCRVEDAEATLATTALSHPLSPSYNFVAAEATLATTAL